ncbi:MAG: glycosyl hydrolase family 28-related protein [Firmicutes bacterium]|nr:glycosyl hydrolase family 28-related protein [Bacillota bacterium]
MNTDWSMPRRHLLKTMGFAAMATAAGMAPLGDGQRAAARTVNDTTSGLNIRDFGARGDGITDDAAAIQAALNAARKSGIDLVVVPAGTYLVGSTLTAWAPIRIVGLGGWATSQILFPSHVNLGLVFRQPSSQFVYPGRAMQLVDLTITYAGSGYAVQFNENGDATVQDTLVSGCRFHVTGNGAALQSLNQRDAIITQSQFLGPNASTGTGIVLNDSDNTKIINNVFYNLQYAIRGERGANRVYDAGTVIIGNSMYGFTEAISFDGWELVQAIGNIVDGATTNCFHLRDCYHSLIMDNYLGPSGSGNALLIETYQPWGSSYVGQIVFQGNFINHYEGPTGLATIAVYGLNKYLPVDQVTIADNIINAYPQHGIHLKYSQNVIISGNTFVAAFENEIPIYDETPGKNVIINNLVDGKIVASGDRVGENFSRYSYPITF